jgi:hypothetical protein
MAALVHSMINGDLYQRKGGQHSINLKDARGLSWVTGV